MIPLPRRLLTSTAEVRVPRAGGYGGEYEEPVAVRHVRFVPKADLRPTAYQLQSPVKGTLYVDAHWSEGAFEIPAGSLVSVDGEESPSCAHECRELSAGGAVHHWEVDLK